LTTKPGLLTLLASDDSEVVITLGAGDIDKMVEPIKKILEKRNI